MTDHATEAERFHNQYRRIRVPGQLPTTADVLALANFHATMAVVDAVRGLAPNTPRDATGSPQSDEQPEPAQADTPKPPKPPQDNTRRNDITASCPTCHHSRMGGITLTATDYNAILARAEKAEAERNAVLHSVRAARASLDPLAHRNPRDEYEQGVRNVARRTLDELDRILDRHTPER